MKVKNMCNKQNSINVTIDYSEIRDMTLANISKLFIEKYKDVLIEYAPLISSSSCYIKLD